MNRKLILMLLLLANFLWVKNTNAQSPRRLTAGEILEKIQKLQVLGTVLYVAAHPDDENTRMIAYLSNELKMNTAYLSLTRGDGGQNLIGSEIRELLGVIRTEELLGARRIDGGQQLFTRANDFGYSKNPEETLEIWEQDQVLADVVWAIRKFQPDVIINRFSHDSGRRTHGHHTSSAILSYKAFDLVGDNNQFTEQLDYVQPWQPQRLFFNTSWWFYGSRDKFNKADKSKMLSVDAGVYYPIKGKSNNEIAAESRSMHKCQGMGSTPSRGSQMEYLQLLKGDMPKNKEDIFDGINTTWSRVKGGKAIGKLFKEIEQNFNYGDPSASVPKLLKAHQLISKIENEYWKKRKLADLEAVIVGCMGLFAEAKADDYSATPGQLVELDVEIINRSNAQATLKSVEILPMGFDSTLSLALTENQSFRFSKKINLPNDMPLTAPYWLTKKASLGMYSVDNQQLRGL
ncbi:MAG: PIG-L family deacetylase, partial [Bacteroidota bacterium]